MWNRRTLFSKLAQVTAIGLITPAISRFITTADVPVVATTPGELTPALLKPGLPGTPIPLIGEGPISPGMMISPRGRVHEASGGCSQLGCIPLPPGPLEVRWREIRDGKSVALSAQFPGKTVIGGIYKAEEWNERKWIIDPRVLWLETLVKQVRARYRCSHGIQMIYLGPEVSSAEYRYELSCLEVHAPGSVGGGFIHYVTVPEEFFKRGHPSTRPYHVAAVFPAEQYDPKWATA